MRSYQRLTLKQRYQIELLLKRGLSLRNVASVLSISPSTVSRELRRSADCYSAETAQLDAVKQAKIRSSKRLKVSGDLRDLIDRSLMSELSPEQISACLWQERQIRVSFKTIYRYIERDRELGGRLKYKLRILRKKRKDRKRPKYRKCEGLVHNRVPISERPKIVDKRSRMGDYERDVMHGKRGGPFFLTIVERKSGYAIIRQINQFNASTIHRATVHALKNKNVKTITNDNGIEFAFHEKTAKALKVKIYFSRSYAAWERGSNENFNGLLRQYFPRRAAIPKLSPAQVRAVQLKLNIRPRKRLGFKTPYEIYHGKPYGQVLR